MIFNRIKVGDTKGAVNAFAYTSNGIIYGLSAAHVLLGSNGKPDLSDLVHIWDDSIRDWVDCSEPAQINLQSGGHSSVDYGRVDAGTFVLSEDLQTIFKQNHFLQPLFISPSLDTAYPKKLRNKVLYAYSVQLDKYISGKIIKVHEKQEFRDEATGILKEYHCDVIIQLKPGQKTTGGDSGLIWYDKNGDAFAMHISGVKIGRTKYSIATFIHRVFSPFQSATTNWFQINPAHGVSL